MSTPSSFVTRITLMGRDWNRPRDQQSAKEYDAAGEACLPDCLRVQFESLTGERAHGVGRGGEDRAHGQKMNSNSMSLPLCSPQESFDFSLVVTKIPFLSHKVSY